MAHCWDLVVSANQWRPPRECRPCESVCPSSPSPVWRGAQRPYSNLPTTTTPCTAYLLNSMNPAAGFRTHEASFFFLHCINPAKAFYSFNFSRNNLDRIVLLFIYFIQSHCAGVVEVMQHYAATAFCQQRVLQHRVDRTARYDRESPRYSGDTNNHVSWTAQLCMIIASNSLRVLELLMNHTTVTIRSVTRTTDSLQVPLLKQALENTTIVTGSCVGLLKLYKMKGDIRRCCVTEMYCWDDDWTLN